MAIPPRNRIPELPFDVADRRNLPDRYDGQFRGTPAVDPDAAAL